MSLIEKLISFLRKPKIVVLCENKKQVEKMASRILRSSFKVVAEVLFVDNLRGVDLPSKKYLILEFDEEFTRKLKEKTQAHILTFGFQKGADFQASDISQQEGTNFKINHEGNIVPVWLKESLSRKEICSVLAAVAIGTIFDLNLVEISQALKEEK
ncbi:MAG: hypothetical protein ABIG08_01200 [bacterium]